MNELRLWQWRYADEFGKRRVFPCRLTEEAAKRLRDAERVEGSLEIRKPLRSTSDFLRLAKFVLTGNYYECAWENV